MKDSRLSRKREKPYEGGTKIDGVCLAVLGTAIEARQSVKRNTSVDRTPRPAFLHQTILSAGSWAM